MGTPPAIKTHEFTCGYCDNKISSEKGLALMRQSSQKRGDFYICPNCKSGTYFSPIFDNQTPAPPIGNSVPAVPEQLNSLYEEARKCTTKGCHTAAVLSCRKILIHIAVENGAEENQSFAHYVGYLSEENYISPQGKEWVDYIRERGNEANHEIIEMEGEEGK